MFCIACKSTECLANLENVESLAAAKSEGQEQAMYFREVVFPAMTELRAPIDELEMIVDEEFWPVPTYGELLFEV